MNVEPDCYIRSRQMCFMNNIDACDVICSEKKGITILYFCFAMKLPKNVPKRPVNVPEGPEKAADVPAIPSLIIPSGPIRA